MHYLPIYIHYISSFACPAHCAALQMPQFLFLHRLLRRSVSSRTCFAPKNEWPEQLLTRSSIHNAPTSPVWPQFCCTNLSLPVCRPCWASAAAQMSCSIEFETETSNTLFWFLFHSLLFFQRSCCCCCSCCCSFCSSLAFVSARMRSPLRIWPVTQRGSRIADWRLSSLDAAARKRGDF